MKRTPAKRTRSRLTLLVRSAASQNQRRLEARVLLNGHHAMNTSSLGDVYRHSTWNAQGRSQSAWLLDLGGRTRLCSGLRQH
mmetsp:Transcript_13294/g.37949  ORF Transcript_13294/g.37949 Transcript_13294/m.37949 type:complete len:82 (+) Transcript_13294:168-413(+)